jgi:hypothetical protein
VPQRGQFVGVCDGESGIPQFVHFMVTVSQILYLPMYHYFS